MNDDQIFSDIKKELARARKAYPTNKHRLAKLHEESGELAQALVKHEESGEKTPNDIYMEAVQTAAMAIRVATEGDSTFPYNPADVV